MAQRMTDEDIEALAESIVRKQGGANACRLFDETQVKTLHRFCESLEGDNWKKWDALLGLGGNIIVSRNVAWSTLVLLVVTFVVGLVGLGLQRWIGGGGMK